MEFDCRGSGWRVGRRNSLACKSFRHVLPLSLQFACPLAATFFFLATNPVRTCWWCDSAVSAEGQKLPSFTALAFAWPFTGNGQSLAR